MTRIISTCLLWWLIVLPAWGEDKPATIDVILWFDTEDYILPASDDAALRLATWLTEQKIPATFKVVGEKARVLEKRGRHDVIDALKKHEIGYHSNWHSVPPTPAQYLNECGWEEGIAEFTRREKPGYDNVARIFGQQPSCYGQPGSSWGPQSHAALHQWGMRVYLDAGSHINVDGKPFWYGGLLNFYKLTHQIRVGLNHPHELESARIQFLHARDQLLAEGGGVISIVYHPCEFIHQQFWDGINFKQGANPSRDQWKTPGVRSTAEINRAYRNFEDYVLFIKRFPGVRFVTASQAAHSYPDRSHERSWTYLQVEKLASQALSDFTKQGIHWVTDKTQSLSTAEVFWLLTMGLAKTIDMEKATTLDVIVADQLPTRLAGPGRVPGQTVKYPTLAASESDLIRTAQEVQKYLIHHQQIPAEVWIGSQPVSPQAYLLAALFCIESRMCRREGKPFLHTWPKNEPELYSAQYVSEDKPQLWRWVIFPVGFQAPKLMALAKLQAWTLKPAIRMVP